MNRLVAVIAVIVTTAAIGLIVLIARDERRGPARCPPGSVALEARCCAPGQTLFKGRCAGAPERCPEGLVPQALPRAGCVPLARRIPIRGGRLVLGPSDWESQGRVEPRVIEVGPFDLDATEITHGQWTQCAGADICRRLTHVEPGVPVTQISPEEAAAFCRFAGGRLPSGDEWLFAAAGTEPRRYPWGQTGLVCRRAVFGLVDGPCGRDTVGPEVVGMRPDGATPEGLLDMAGNVAEWTVELSGRHVARGGSFRSRVAANLKSWAVEEIGEPRDHVGFRCAYDLPSDEDDDDG